MRAILRAGLRVYRRLFERPLFVAMGAGSFVRAPWRISNRRRIRIGCDTRIGRNVILNPMTRAESGMSVDGLIAIGDDVYVGHNTQLHACSAVRLGTGVVLSDYVYVNDSAHGLDPQAGPIMRQPFESRGPIDIGCHAFIGYGAVVFGGVTLGDHCVVGANSVVTRSFPAHSMVAGAPARLIKRYDPAQGRWCEVDPADAAAAGGRSRHD